MYERVFKACYSFNINSKYFDVFIINIVHIKITVHPSKRDGYFNN
jgi:hypothetical protein